MIEILQDTNYRNLLFSDRPVKVTDPVTIIKQGACVMLDGNGEVVLTDANASQLKLVYWTVTSANDPNNFRSDFYVTGNVTLIQGVFLAETDMYDTNASYSIGARLTTKNGVWVPAITGEFVYGRTLKPPVGGKIHVLTVQGPGIN